MYHYLSYSFTCKFTEESTDVESSIVDVTVLHINENDTTCQILLVETST